MKIVSSPSKVDTLPEIPSKCTVLFAQLPETLPETPSTALIVIFSKLTASNSNPELTCWALDRKSKLKSVSAPWRSSLPQRHLPQVYPTNRQVRCSAICKVSFPLPIETVPLVAFVKTLSSPAWVSTTKSLFQPKWRLGYYPNRTSKPCLIPIIQNFLPYTTDLLRYRRDREFAYHSRQYQVR